MNWGRDSANFVEYMNDPGAQSRSVVLWEDGTEGGTIEQVSPALFYLSALL